MYATWRSKEVPHVVHWAGVNWSIHDKPWLGRRQSIHRSNLCLGIAGLHGA